MMETDLLGQVPHDPGGRSKPRWPAGSVIKSRFGGVNDCYRYELTETWDTSLPAVMFLMMNPSVAGVEHADPTLIKTGKFARSWGFGSQIIANIHAYRATDSTQLAGAGVEPIGPDNDRTILHLAGQAKLIVLAYGQPKPKALRARGPRVAAMLRESGFEMTCLRLSKDLTPYHPLYLADALVPIAYRVTADVAAK
jgi:hypothetical protein